MPNLRLLQQIIAPLQQWLLEQGKCAACGEQLTGGQRKNGSEGEIVSCSCGKSYLYLPKANLYKRLIGGKYER